MRDVLVLLLSFVSPPPDRVKRFYRFIGFIGYAVFVGLIKQAGNKHIDFGCGSELCAPPRLKQ